MNVGNNLLSLALTVINSKTVDYYEFISREINADGQFEATWADPIEITGSLQSIGRTYQNQLGLDMTKSYVMWYDPRSLAREVRRNTTGDKIVYFGQTFIAEDSSDWSHIDGWKGVLFVQVPE